MKLRNLIFVLILSLSTSCVTEKSMVSSPKKEVIVTITSSEYSDNCDGYGYAIDNCTVTKDGDPVAILKFKSNDYPKAVVFDMIITDNNNMSLDDCLEMCKYISRKYRGHRLVGGNMTAFYNNIEK